LGIKILGKKTQRKEVPKMKGNLPMNVRKIITAKMAKGYKRASKREKGKILDSLESSQGSTGLT